MVMIDNKLEKWKNKLLDLGKRNRLINFKNSKRGTLKIISSDVDSLYNDLVIKEKVLDFPVISTEVNEDEVELKIIPGDLETDRTIQEQQKTLGSLRSKSRSAKEEQGINILYLCLGFLKWFESDNSKQELRSPLILVPVKINVTSLIDPYTLSVDEDEVLVNPTLIYKLENDFGITIPQFNSDEDNVSEYLDSLKPLFKDMKWDIEIDCSLGLLSFLKVNMYKDIENNSESMKEHPIIRAIAGEKDSTIQAPVDLINFDHDRKTKPLEVFQVVDADSSQQDAILYAKSGCSFVLQGPPGTGKSQTITNIISECLADGKKILFVSEKMAALEVVYGRLASVGLSDFCLTLHSYKANKKEVLSQLYRMLNYDKVKLRDEALYELEKLEKEREELNKYDEELHKVRTPINMSVYEINGRLSTLNNVENIIFDIKDIENTTKERRNEYEYHLDKFSKTLGIMDDDFRSNPWRNCNVDSVTNELRHDIETYLKRLLPKLRELTETHKSTNSRLGLSIFNSIKTNEDLINLLSVCKKSPIVPKAWLENKDIAKISEEVRTLNNIKLEYKSIMNELMTKHGLEYFNLDSKYTRVSFLELIDDIKQKLQSHCEDSNVLSSIESYIELLKETIIFMESIIIRSKDVEELLQSSKINTLNDFIKHKNLIELLKKKPRPTEMWFDDSYLNIVEKEALKIKGIYSESEQALNELKEKYDESILKIDFDEILTRYKTEYTSFTKILKKSYKEDKKLLLSFSLNIDKKLEDSEAIKALKLVKKIKDNEKWLQDNDKRIVDMLGKWYVGSYTNWNELDEALVIFKRIKEWFQGHRISDNIITILLTTQYEGEIIDISNKLEILLSRNYVDEANGIFKVSDNLLEIDVLVSKNRISEYLEKVIELQKINNEINKANTESLVFEEVVDDLNKLERIQEIEGDFKKKENYLKEKLSFLYNGIETDFQDIQEMLTWTALFREQVKKNDVPIDFSNKVCGDEEFIKSVSRELEELVSKKNKVRDDLNWFLRLFDFKEEIINEDLDKVINRFEACLNKLIDLEYWIDYRSSREKCNKIGLGDFIDKVERNKIPSSMVVNVFRKRFYRLLLDKISEGNDTLSSFRRRLQDDRILEFRRLDKEQLKIANLRVKEKLINQLPNTNIFTSSVDEVGIIKREVNKQRKIMPLRKLFKSIPNLILTLKPCLMMSPLSVSLFLESENFKFDVVIFDEGSQVCTENAVGAIFRGKQVIIAGDKNQLPPTNFFNSSTSNSEYDELENDDMYEDSDGYESVLDEALRSLPEKTLMWHYRSRHEHLITFSNVKIYNGDLTTFPSNVDRVKDNGVEYVYVKNGVFERGGKTCNTKEANKVVELIYEHMKKHPERSLGVVTFSEAQQDAVNVALKKRRIDDPRYEKYFSEDIDTPFFVKNIENVQGDERDTIIFSIGYAKDAHGKMYMNFGPLSNQGGHRRLNVAITRAKFNLKLVGSILPTDIDLERTTSEGVKLLKSYIEFAQRGPVALASEITTPDVIELESPFEESVYNFLLSKGYKVATQVGCSGYRIDLAIKHPTLNGVYVLAVECDGATYHSARTARERDRLRQTVLEDIGWTVYRIWSVDWIKDSIAEGERLIEAVEKAIAQYGIDDGVKEESALDEEGSVDEKQYLNVISEENLVESKGYGFDLYEETDVSIIPRELSDIKYLINVITTIVKGEQPIHFELLCRRIAYLFGNQKVTVKIRDNARFIIERYLQDSVEVVDVFCWIKDDRTIKVRMHNPEIENTRPINYICKEEISEAINEIVKASIGISKESLFNVVGKLFGFNRLGQQISRAFEEAYNYSIDNNYIDEIEGKLKYKR